MGNMNIFAGLSARPLSWILNEDEYIKAKPTCKEVEILKNSTLFHKNDSNGVTPVESFQWQ
jgi:hypothetical protein